MEKRGPETMLSCVSALESGDGDWSGQAQASADAFSSHGLVGEYMVFRERGIEIIPYTIFYSFFARVLFITSAPKSKDTFPINSQHISLQTCLIYKWGFWLICKLLWIWYLPSPFAEPSLSWASLLCLFDFFLYFFCFTELGSCWVEILFSVIIHHCCGSFLSSWGLCH